MSFFTTDGTFLRNLATKGDQDGQVRNPQALSITDEGNIIVTDRGNRRIQVFTPDGRLLLKFGNTGHGYEKLQLQDPAACVYYRDHYIVTDWSGECIKLYDRRGQFVKNLNLQWVYEWNPMVYVRPHGITSTNCGNIIVTDVNYHRLVMFRLDGSVIATTGYPGFSLGEFYFLSDVSVLCDKVIIVSDLFYHRLQVLHHP